MRRIDILCYEIAGEVTDFLSRAMESMDEETVVDFHLDNMFEPWMAESFDIPESKKEKVAEGIYTSTVTTIEMIPPDKFKLCPQAFRLMLTGALVFAVRDLTIREYENGQA